MSNDNDDEFQVEEPSTPSGLKAEGLMVRREAPLPEPEGMEDELEDVEEMEAVEIIPEFESKEGHIFGLTVSTDEEGDSFVDVTMDNVNILLPLEDFCQFALTIDAALPKLLEIVGKKIQENN